MIEENWLDFFNKDLFKYEMAKFGSNVKKGIVVRVLLEGLGGGESGIRMGNEERHREDCSIIISLAISR